MSERLSLNSLRSAYDSLYWESLQELIDFLVAHLLAELCQDVSQLSGADETVSGFVEDLETFDEFVYQVS